MDLLEKIGAVLGVITGFIAVGTFVASFWTARSGNQRELRERLRQQLRQIEIACFVYFQREGWTAVRESPTYSFQALEHIHEDGLLSPSKSHLDNLGLILRDIRNCQEAMAPPPPTIGTIFSAAQPSEMVAAHKRRMNSAFEVLDRESHRYLRALGKMDNAGIGGYWTYLRYRLIPPRRYIKVPRGRYALASEE